jgi:putative solute:sodium symporter small subunit
MAPCMPGRIAVFLPMTPPRESELRATAAASPLPGRARWHWRSTRRLTLALLVVWALVSFVLPWHARSLNFGFFGWPFSFWMAAQGAMLVYLLLVVVFALLTPRIDEAHGFDEPR